jgi:hypothetical protein
MGVNKMNPKNSQAVLTLSEPWELSFRILGKLEEIITLNEYGLLFKGENGKKYLLSTRYMDDQIDNIWRKKYLIVNVFDISDSPVFSMEPIKIAELFIGSGSVEINILKKES